MTYRTMKGDPAAIVKILKRYTGGNYSPPPADELPQEEQLPWQGLLRLSLLSFIHAGRGPILKGKAPVLRGLGAETRRAVSFEPHLGQETTSSSSKASSSKVCRQALHSKSYKGMAKLLARKGRTCCSSPLLLSKHPTPAGKVKAKAFFVPEEGVGKIW